MTAAAAKAAKEKAAKQDESKEPKAEDRSLTDEEIEAENENRQREALEFLGIDFDEETQRLTFMGETFVHVGGDQPENPDDQGDASRSADVFQHLAEVLNDELGEDGVFKSQVLIALESVKNRAASLVQQNEINRKIAEASA